MCNNCRRSVILVRLHLSKKFKSMDLAKSIDRRARGGGFAPGPSIVVIGHLTTCVT